MATSRSMFSKRAIPLPPGEGGAQRRVRAGRSTILQIDEIVGRAALIRPFRPSLEKDSLQSAYPRLAA
jgi:hypothetical protein